jgi:hypothetical protein
VAWEINDEPFCSNSLNKLCGWKDRYLNIRRLWRMENTKIINPIMTAPLFFKDITDYYNILYIYIYVPSIYKRVLHSSFTCLCYHTIYWVPYPFTCSPSIDLTCNILEFI